MDKIQSHRLEADATRNRVHPPRRAPGFIRAEIYGVPELEKYKTEKAIREAGKLRIEGKDYVMRDADVCHFLFNV